jgi:hypothetical protein
VVATDVEVMIWAFLGGVVIIAACWVSYQCGKRVERQDQEELAAERLEFALAAEREHRVRQLREHGRIHDVREDASGPPATSHPITVLGASPRHRPPTRM